MTSYLEVLNGMVFPQCSLFCANHNSKINVTEVNKYV